MQCVASHLALQRHLVGGESPAAPRLAGTYLNPHRVVGLAALALATAALVGVLPSVSHGIVLHEVSVGPDPRPPEAAVGRWVTNASCVAVGPTHVITTCHQGYGVGREVEVGGQTYEIAEIVQHGKADLRVVGIVDPSDPDGALAVYVPLYTGTDEADYTAVIGGFGDGRGQDLVSGDIHYGYEWAPDADLVLRWGENAIDGSGVGGGSGYDSDVIYAHFDGPDACGAEAATAEHDSGGGWFINLGTAGAPRWVVAGLTRGVERLHESWFRNPDGSPDPDYIDAVRVGSYADWINGILHPYQWSADADGDWSDAGNWSDDGYWTGGYPDGSDRWAVFAGAITAGRTVTLDENVTVGVLRLDAGQTYCITGTHTLTLRSDDNTVAAIEVNRRNDGACNGAHRIEVPLRLKDPLVLTQCSGGALTLAGPINDWLAFACDIAKRGDGEVILAGDNSGLSGDITVEQGVLSAAHPLALGGGQVLLAGGDLHLLAEADTAFSGAVKVTADAALLAGPVSAGSDATLSVGSLTLLAPAGGMTLTIAGTDGYGLAVEGGTVFSDGVTVHTASADLALAGGVQLATGTLTKTGPGTLTLDGAQAYGPGTAVEVAGGAVRFNGDTGDADHRPLTVQVDGSGIEFASTQHLAGLHLLAGEADCAQHGDRTLVTSDLQIAETAGEPAAVLDLRDNNLVVDYDTTSPYEAIEAWVATGYNGGDWNGPGICSAAAAGDPQGITGLGVLDNDDPNPDLGGLYDLEGETLTTPAENDFTQVLVMFTYYGDANLDGQVRFADLNLLIYGWENQPPGGAEDPRWGVGDFNYNGQVSFADLNLLIYGWENQGDPLGAPAASGTSVGVGSAVLTPEPATVALLAVGLGAMLARRRARSA